MAQDNSAEGLLRSWYEWWRDTDDAPVKMPAALHIRTAMYFVLRDATTPEAMEAARVELLQKAGEL